MGRSPKHIFTPEHNRIIAEQFKTKTVNQIAEIIGHSHSAVQNQIKRLREQGKLEKKRLTYQLPAEREHLSYKPPVALSRWIRDQAKESGLTAGNWLTQTLQKHKDGLFTEKHRHRLTDEPTAPVEGQE